MQAEPLTEELTNDIDSEKIGPKTDPKERSALLVSDYGWELGDTKKIWAFGPETNGPNIVVDATK